MIKHAKFMTFWKVNMTQTGSKLKIKVQGNFTNKYYLKAQWPMMLLALTIANCEGSSSLWMFTENVMFI